MEKVKILWVDDEVDMLKPHILFLEKKGYEVFTVTNGQDALDILEDTTIDIMFLDENMPGLSGLDTLSKIPEKFTFPVVMITKSEEESIMDEAIGAKIADYLIKPVNPMQILLTIKKQFEKSRLVNETTTYNYQKEFQKLGMDIAMAQDYEDWVNIYNRLVYWELELDSANSSLNEVLNIQKKEANSEFFKFIKREYADWFSFSEDAPTLSHNAFQKLAKPVLVEDDNPVFLLLIDNLRLDQWKTIKRLVEQEFRVEKESFYFSILPTTTQYARNAFFAGLTPLEISKKYADQWKFDHEEGGKNLFESELLRDQIQRMGLNIKHQFHKITHQNQGQKLVGKFNEIKRNKLNAIVYNFVDMLSHAKTNTEMIKELAPNDKAYRELTLTWFNNSTLLELLKLIKSVNGTVIITTDHGMINIEDPSKIVGDKETSTNLRYKTGKNLNYNKKDVLEILNPTEVQLPKFNVSSKFVFAKENKFLVYPNNYKYFSNYYKNTYQHGGVSLEEMICPFIVLKPN